MKSIIIIILYWFGLRYCTGHVECLLYICYTWVQLLVYDIELISQGRAMGVRFLSSEKNNLLTRRLKSNHYRCFHENAHRDNHTIELA